MGHQGQLYDVPFTSCWAARCAQGAGLRPREGPHPEKLIEEAVRLENHGFTALGHLNPLLDEDETTPYFKTHAQKIEDATETVRLLREAVGQGSTCASRSTAA